ncbi:hypothetical protein [Phascolarctobacterium faecium]
MRLLALPQDWAVRSAGTGAANLQGRNARKATLASIGERAKCATE